MAGIIYCLVEVEQTVLRSKFTVCGKDTLQWQSFFLIIISLLCKCGGKANAQFRSLAVSCWNSEKFRKLYSQVQFNEMVIQMLMVMQRISRFYTVEIRIAISFRSDCILYIHINSFSGMKAATTCVTLKLHSCCQRYVEHDICKELYSLH